MKMRQGAEIPDALVFKRVAEENMKARVTIITKEEIDKLMDRRLIDSGFRVYWPFNRRRS